MFASKQANHNSGRCFSKHFKTNPWTPSAGCSHITLNAHSPEPEALPRSLSVTSALRHRSLDSCNVAGGGAGCRETHQWKAMEDKAQIQEAIKVQGEVVRKLKSEKASKEQVSSEHGDVKARFSTCGEKRVHLPFSKTGWLASWPTFKQSVTSGVMLPTAGSGPNLDWAWTRVTLCGWTLMY